VPLNRIFIPNIGMRVFCRAFTLSELMITLAIAGILTAIAAPAIGNFLASSTLSTTANEFIADLNYARGEVLKRRTNAANSAINVGVCKSNDRATCTAAGTWTNGWIVFVDNDSSGSWSAGDELLRAHEALPSNNSITSTADVIVYNNQGQLAASGAAGSYTICNSQIHQSRVVRILTSGRPGLERGTC